MDKKYFFSYSYSIKRQYDTIAGFGNCELMLSGNIDLIHDITKIADKISNEGGYSAVTILHWREF